MTRTTSLRDTLPAERPGHPASEALLARRALTAGMPTEAGPGVTVTDRVLGGVPCRTVAAPSSRRTVVHLHGGAYRMGGAAGWTVFAARLARAAEADVVLPDYRLAPEHPFPAAVHDAAAVYEAVRAEAAGRGHDVVVSGDSAGGGLAAALTVAAAAAGAPLPDALVLVSPWLDLGCGSPTFASRAADDPLFPLESAREAAGLYLQGHPADDPLASPLRAGDTPFPPTLLLVSSDETLLGDSLELARQLAGRRARVALEVVPGRLHAWPTIQPDTPEAEAAVRRVAAFLAEAPAA